MTETYFFPFEIENCLDPLTYIVKVELKKCEVPRDLRDSPRSAHQIFMEEAGKK